MVELSGLESALLIVTSIIVLIYAVFYITVLYQQVKSGQERRNWKVSLLFYLGIVFFVLSEALIALSSLYPGIPAQSIGVLLKFAAMITFVFAFYFRMKGVALRHAHAARAARSTQSVTSAKKRR
jgi:hypothetical protein